MCMEFGKILHLLFNFNVFLPQSLTSLWKAQNNLKVCLQQSLQMLLYD